MANNVDLVMRLLAEDRASQAFKGVGKEVEKTGSKFSKFAKVSAGALAGVGVVAFAKDAIGAASNMNETISKSQVVFGKSADAVSAWGDTAASAMLLSKQEAIEAASTFGNLFVSMKIGGPAAADMSMKMTQLAGDLASFNNVDVSDALDALRSGLVGETEPLRRFGVNLNDADLRQKALAMGLMTSTKSVLPPAVKAQAAYALILDQTKTAQGDVARTGDGLANQQRELQAEFENTKAKLGESLLPAMNAGVHVANKVVGAFNALPTPVRNSALAVGILGTAFVVLVPKIAAAKVAMMELGGATTGLSSKGRGLAGVLGKVGIAAAAAELASSLDSTTDKVNASTANMGDLLKQIGATGQGMDKLGYSVDGITTYTQNFNDALYRMSDPSVWDKISGGLESITGIDGDMKLSAQSIQGVDAALAKMVTDGSAAQAQDAFLKLRQSFADTGGDVSKFDAQFSQYRSSLDALLPTTKDVATATGKVGTAAQTAKQKLDAYKTAIDKIIGNSLSAKQRSLQWRDSIAELTKSIKENGRSLAENTAKGRANAEALLDRVQAAADSAQADLDAGVSLDKVKDKYANQIKQLREAAVKAGLNAAAVDKLVGAYAKLPSSKTVTVKTPGLTSALKQLQNINAELRKIDGHGGISVTVDSRGDLAGHGTAGAATPPHKKVRSTSPSPSAPHGAGVAVVHVNLDGRQIQQSIVQVKRQQGGVYAQ